MHCEWKTVRLADVSEVITKGTTPTTLGHKFTESGFNFVKSESITFDGWIDPAKFAFIDEQTHNALMRSKLEEGDVLFSMAGVYIGKTAVVPKTILPANTNQAVGIVRLDKNRAVPRFIDYYLRNPSYNLFMNNLVAQSAQPNLNLTEIRNLPIRLPPLAEQKAIAAVLGTLDDKIELNRRLNATLEAMARTLFQSWFVDFDPVRAKLDGRQPTGLDASTAALFPSEFEDSELGPIPIGWEVGSILRQAYLLSGGTPKTDVAEFWNGDIAWASAKDVSQCGGSFLTTTEKKITQSGLQKSATKMIPQFATVIVARGATTGRLTMFGERMAMNQTCYALHSRFDAPFALYCQARDFIKRMVHAAHGSVFDTITTRTFESTTVLLPPANVLLGFNERIAPLIQLLRANLYQSRTLAAIRDALLPRLLNGEFRLTSRHEAA
jgi:type I restriction enzyme, S subunit